MVERALVGRNATLTKAVYEICSTISHGVLNLLLETVRAAGSAPAVGPLAYSPR